LPFIRGRGHTDVVVAVWVVARDLGASDRLDDLIRGLSFHDREALVEYVAERLAVASPDELPAARAAHDVVVSAIARLHARRVF
jgi:hypothetical protein